jgi:hypothetical protein
MQNLNLCASVRVRVRVRARARARVCVNLRHVELRVSLSDTNAQMFLLIKTFTRRT